LELEASICKLLGAFTKVCPECDAPAMSAIQTFAHPTMGFAPRAGDSAPHHRGVPPRPVSEVLLQCTNTAPAAVRLVVGTTNTGRDDVAELLTLKSMLAQKLYIPPDGSITTYAAVAKLDHPVSSYLNCFK